MAISDQFLRPGNMGLFWVTCPSSGQRSYPAPMMGSGWEEPISDRKWFREDSLCRTLGADNGLQSRPVRDPWPLEVPWSLCSAKGISASSCNFCHTLACSYDRPVSSLGRPLDAEIWGLLESEKFLFLRYGDSNKSEVHNSKEQRSRAGVMSQKPQILSLGSE